MIGWGCLDQRGNTESLQRDGLARFKAVDAFPLPVMQNINTVSLPTTDLNFNPPPPNPPNFLSYLRKPDETRVDVMPNRIFIRIFVSVCQNKGLTLPLYSVNARQKGPNDLCNQYTIDS